MSRSQWVVTKNGNRFIVETAAAEATAPTLNIITNWTMPRTQ
jgi:hypothetical protein